MKSKMYLDASSKQIHQRLNLSGICLEWSVNGTRANGTRANATRGREHRDGEHRDENTVMENTVMKTP